VENIINNIAGLALKAYVKNLAKKRLPQLDGNIKLQGLKDKVEVIRDEWGIPHIYAQNIEDAMFAQGYIHAQDRLWQMEMYRRASQGRLSEFLGKDAVETDKVCRTMGYARTAKKDIDNFEEKEKIMMQAYADGVNAFIEKNKNNLPVEFALLKHTPEPWSPIDSCSFNRLLIALLSWGWYDEIIRAKLIETVGVDAAAELDNTYTPHHPITLPNGIEFNMLDIEEKFAAMKSPYIPNISGSNAWTVHGSKTDTGKPYLCNDPHLVLQNPNIWYMMHIHTPEWHASGVSVPSQPMILIGHNANIGWGITLSFSDIEDVFIEKFTDDTCSSYIHEEKELQTNIIEEKIFVKDQNEPVVESVMETIHGPVISDITGYKHQKLTLCSMALKPGKSVYGWYCLNMAKNWDDFVEGVSHISAPGLNICYADIDGNIGYYNSGKVPIRDKASASVPMPGWDGKSDWKDFVPFKAMPHALNPERGYIYTCNHKVEPKDYPYFLGDIYMNGYRASRLDKLFSQKEKFNPDDFNTMQMDLHCTPATQFTAHFKDVPMKNPELQQYADLLMAWDGVLRPNQIESTFYQVAKYFAVNRMYESAIADKKLRTELQGKGFNSLYGPVNSFLGHNTVTLLRILDNPKSWWIEKVGGKSKLLSEAFADGIQWLKFNYGNKKEKWQWGNVHAIVFPHGFAEKKPMDRVFNIGPYPIGGDTDTLCQTCTLATEGFGGELAAPSYRQIIDFSDFSKSKIIMPLGQSANMSSPYYKNMLQNWLDGQYIPMLWTREDVEKYQAHKLVLEA
jgi:penicillin amidase